MNDNIFEGKGKIAADRIAYKKCARVDSRYGLPIMFKKKRKLMIFFSFFLLKFITKSNKKSFFKLKMSLKMS